MDLSFRSRKRSRDDEDDFSIRIEGVPADKKQRNIQGLQLPPWLRAPSEQRQSINRAHTLPFRLDHVATSLPPPVFEPPEADDTPTDSSSGNSPASFISLPGPPDLSDANMDMTMDEHSVSIAGSASPPSPFTQTHPYLIPSHRPDKLNSPGLNAFSGRIPTPIHSNFDLAQPPMPARSRTDSFLPATNGMNMLPRFAGPMKQIFENDYRMPSPIVESPLIEDSIDDAMDMSDLPSSQLSRLSVSQDSMDVDDTIWSQHMTSSDNLGFDVIPPTPTTPGRTGRARSGAFSASSTPQEQEQDRNGGRKVVFGYREDCEKCRMRFPGHFAHFV